MGEFISGEVKGSWGMRCTEDASGNLKFGKGHTGIPMNSTFNKETLEIIRNALNKVRGNRGGRFWFDGVSQVIVIDGNMNSGFKYFKVDIDTGRKEKIDPFEYD